MLSNLKLGVAKKRMAAVIKNTLSSSGRRVQRVGVLIDVDDDEVIKQFRRLQNDLELRDTHFQFVTCKAEGSLGTVFEGLVFTRKDLGWNGRIRNGEITTFVEQETDVLISFTKEDNKLAALLVSVSNSGLKVGRKEGKASAGLFDLVISTPFEEAGIFVDELKKYLKILNTTE